MLSHLNALAFVRWAVGQFGVGPDDRLSNHAPLHFDLSVFDLFAAAMAGATVVLVPPELSVFPVQIRDFIEEKRITIWYSVPSILSMLTLRGGLEPGALPDLRSILFAGEVFPTKYLRQLMTLLPHVRFSNLYGPTETNVCTWFDVEHLPEPTAPIPIGRAIDDVDVFAVTDDGRPAGPGEEGELFVHGPTVMRGYWGDQRAHRSGDRSRSGGAVPVASTAPEIWSGSERTATTGSLADGITRSRVVDIGSSSATWRARSSRTRMSWNARRSPCRTRLITNRIHAFVVARDRDRQEGAGPRSAGSGSLTTWSRSASTTCRASREPRRARWIGDRCRQFPRR